MIKPFKNRLIIASICILIAALCIFLGIATINQKNSTITIVSTTKDIRKGSIISSDMLKSTTISSYNISTGYATSTDELVGKFALADFATNDFVQTSKVATTLPNSDEKLLQLDGSRLAISVTLKDFSRGVSDKIASGDIVSCIVTSNETTTIPQELTYVEVLTTTTISGIDKERAGDFTSERTATVTLLVSPGQAKLLAMHEITSQIHFALVSRGNEELAKALLEQQTTTLKGLINIPINEEVDMLE